MSRYTGVTERELRQMLDAIGVDSVDELFADVPEGVRLRRDIDLPAGRSEQEVFEHLAALAARNRHCDEEVTFLGAGMYDHYVPAVSTRCFSAPSSSRPTRHISPRYPRVDCR
jgi:glycine dehydrogenase subunit 1